MTEVASFGFTPTAEELYHVGHQTCNIIPRGAKERCLSQVAEVLRFRLELRPVIALLRGELYARQAIARGDDMCYMVVIPSIRLYRFEVANILKKSKTPSIVDMGYICIILIFQWNKLMGTQ